MSALPAPTGRNSGAVGSEHVSTGPAPSRGATLFGNSRLRQTRFRFGIRSVSGVLPSDQIRSFNWTDPI